MRKFLRILKITVIIATISATVLTTGIVIYGWHLSDKVTERFSSRRWSLPSKVYSDTMLIYPGQRLNGNQFVDKLKRLGYRETPTPPTRKGQMNVRAGGLHIFLKDLETPWEKREGFPVYITFSRNSIYSIARTDKHETLPIVEIDPEEIMLFFGPEREQRRLVNIKAVPEHFIHALLATEDTRFFTHWGIDPKGILRAFWTNLRHGGIRQGGSTITQQLAKNYFLTPERSLKRKLREALLAIVIELKYPKEVILEIYLNEIYLGQRGSVAVNGIGEAADFYFGKPAKFLTLSESAAIAGLIKGPNAYSPYKNKKACHTRKNLVLGSMLRNGYITEETYQAEKEITVKPVGYTTSGNKAPYFIDYLTKQLKQLYKPEDLESLGLSIFTTIDSHVQRAAEKALKRGLERLEKEIPSLKRKDPRKQLQGAIVAFQPKTGHILAMVGGRDYSKSQYNRVTQARRQAGSVFKPFVFLTALDTFTPISMLSNEPRVYMVNGKEWRPKNIYQSKEETRTVCLRKAIEKSYNIATIDLAMQVGLDRVIETAGNFKFSTPFKPYPSLALGAFEVIPIEMASAYCVFAAGGTATFPLSLKAVTDGDGAMLEQRHLTMEQKISPQKAFMINTLLRGVVERGTAHSLRNLGIHWPVAGKTGTTNNNRDAWFIGYTPDILALVWVGFDNGDSVLSTGSRAALPIWADLMQSVTHHVSENDFRMPRGITTRKVCMDKNDKPKISKYCRNSYEEYFLEENPPEKSDGKTPRPGFFNRFKSIFK